MVESNRVEDVMNAMHNDKYDAITNNALNGYFVWGIGYDTMQSFRTWLTFSTDEAGKRWITGFFIVKDGRKRTYKGWRGWARSLDRLTHSTAKVYRSRTEFLGTAEQVYPEWDNSR